MIIRPQDRDHCLGIYWCHHFSLRLTSPSRNSAVDKLPPETGDREHRLSRNRKPHFPLNRPFAIAKCSRLARPFANSVSGIKRRLPGSLTSVRPYGRWRVRNVGLSNLTSRPLHLPRQDVPFHHVEPAALTFVPHDIGSTERAQLLWVEPVIHRLVGKPFRTKSFGSPSNLARLHIKGSPDRQARRSRLRSQ